ncbi:DUF1206 domain-containing protein [Actinomadura viridis]|uniref:DUF1206 domain-containing protein n=1 Tax=Actinomadura viridis TaxID=58110 RepID=A0A931GPQ6_9ACTN|nr:DUF1206 domain-containing protein [Actinomadura viridis]MBG6087649.1 hypothetical protein [Actinomadura viridis]
MANAAAKVPRTGWRGAGRRTAGHPWFHLLSRVGLAARGVIYLVVGWLAVQIVLGNGGHEADQRGALETVVANPGGIVAVWLVAAGFAGLVLWQFAEARYGRPVPGGHKAHNRAFAFGRGLIYLVGFAGTLGFAIGVGGKSGDQQSQAFTARAMAEPGGRWLVLAVGAGFMAVGTVAIVNAVRRAFLEEFDTARMPAAARRAVVPLGVVGNCARGLVLGGVGVFLGYAAVDFDPRKAKGLDGTLREFAATPAGPWLLAAVAGGLAVFGIYAFFEARWRKVEAVRS